MLMRRRGGAERPRAPVLLPSAFHGSLRGTSRRLRLTTVDRKGLIMPNSSLRRTSGPRRDAFLDPFSRDLWLAVERLLAAGLGFDSRDLDVALGCLQARASAD